MAARSAGHADPEGGPPPRTLDIHSSNMDPQPPSTSDTNRRTTRTTPAKSTGPSDTIIDPDLADLPAPKHVHRPDSANGNPSIEITSYPPPGTRDLGASMSITESIALAPQPRTTDFSMLPLNEDGIDLQALDAAADDGTPGSPTSKLMKAIAPPNAAQASSNWPAVSNTIRI